MKTFKEKVLDFVKNIPKGKVVSYGQVASAIGSPRAARQVGAVLGAINTFHGLMPWWRVVNNKGIISIKGNWVANKEDQKKLLTKDGVEVSKDFTINMEKYRWSR